MKIKMLKKDLTDFRKCYYIKLVVNQKTIEISILEDYNYNFNGDYISVDWNLLTDIELNDEEHDSVDEWVKTFRYDKEEKNERRN